MILKKNLIRLHCLHEGSLASSLAFQCTANSDQTDLLPKLIWIFSGNNCHCWFHLAMAHQKTSEKGKLSKMNPNENITFDNIHKFLLLSNSNSVLENRMNIGMILHQTWGELIVNAYALLMHYFFPVIQGND